MAPDQAAGLRRRHGGEPLRCLHGLFESSDAATRLAEGLGRQGRVVLLVDASGRPRTDANTRSLFDTGRQLARGQPHLAPRAFGDVWHAPGLAADAPGFGDVASRYDCVIFDHGADSAALGRWLQAAQLAIVDVTACAASRQRAYRIVKTLARSTPSLRIGLVGDAASCAQVREACRQFLGAAEADAIDVFDHSDDAFVTHVIRMAGEETGRTACN